MPPPCDSMLARILLDGVVPALRSRARKPPMSPRAGLNLDKKRNSHYGKAPAASGRISEELSERGPQLLTAAVRVNSLITSIAVPMSGAGYEENWPAKYLLI